MRLESLVKKKNVCDLIAARTRDLKAWSIAPQSYTLRRAPVPRESKRNIKYGIGYAKLRGTYDV
jgi:hypothetical protein